MKFVERRFIGKKYVKNKYIISNIGIGTQDRIDAVYRNPKMWNRMSLVNIARSGFFSSDRADTIPRIR